MPTTEFWQQLTTAEATALDQLGRRTEFARGAVVCRQADTTDWVVVLRTGWVKISVDTANGTEVVLAVRGPGALLGELAALDREPRSATVTAIEDVTALTVPVAAFESYLQTHGRVALLIMRMLTSRLRDADRKRIEFGAHDTTGRVAARLVEMAERFGERTGEDGSVRIALPFSQDELAGWTGASRESVSKALGQLRRAGWIHTSRRSVVVHDIGALRRRSA